ncbi:origin recognition complex subunit 2 [Athelia psychrophila]|uniref:Origin recognition complex subunit 2 n=1 Tax=Athelia psychrophila TaxID=1759441 RepID=A0A166A6R9_9AGAM|nr:origin recognition complex subunit 2 [Fibularhizoctonia sp. CBS 109695]
MGSKRIPINMFASEVCSKKGHVVVVNAFLATFNLKDMLGSIERVPGVADLVLPLGTGGAERQARRITDFFAQSPKRRLFLVIHNIDAPPLRSAKAKSCLSLLASSPCIHIIASIDRINAPLLWSSTESSVRKQHHDYAGDRRGYAWLWHDLTTLAAYDVELAQADRSSISGVAALHSSAARHQQDAGAAATAGVAMTETAATHILASVTQKAKKLFVLLGTKQVESMDEATDATGANAQQYALAYDLLFNLARDNFIATNDTAMRSLLGEFRDHGLVVSAAQGGPGSGELLWIPMRKERLSKILGALKTEQEG